MDVPAKRPKKLDKNSRKKPLTKGLFFDILTFANFVYGPLAQLVRAAGS